MRLSLSTDQRKTLCIAKQRDELWSVITSTRRQFNTVLQLTINMATIKLHS